MKYFFSCTFFLLIIFNLLSCHKDPGTDYFMTLKVENKKFTFLDSLVATRRSTQPALVVYGNDKTNGTFSWLLSDFSTGNYLNTYDLAEKKRIYEFTMNGIVSNDSNGMVILQLTRPDPSIGNTISLNITKITESYIEGNFSGVLNSVGITYPSVTGEFRIPIK